jgi:hypothetical protein
MIFRREKFARVPLKFYVVSWEFNETWEFETSVQEFLHGRRFILTKIETGYVYLETWKLRCKKLCMDRPLYLVERNVCRSDRRGMQLRAPQQCIVLPVPVEYHVRRNPVYECKYSWYSTKIVYDTRYSSTGTTAGSTCTEYGFLCVTWGFQIYESCLRIYSTQVHSK